MPFLNKLFGKTKKEPKKGVVRIKPVVEEKKIETEVKKPEIKSDILSFPISTEKAVSGQALNKYIFKVPQNTNKIEIAKAVGKTYNVKAVSVNIINIPKKARMVGKTKGFKTGYKKAVITLAKGQSIKIK